MKYLLRNPLRFHRERCRLFLFGLIFLSLTSNLFLLLTKSATHEAKDWKPGMDICTAISNYEGGQKVMSYIHSEKNIDTEVRDAFVYEIHRCLNRNDDNVGEKRRERSMGSHNGELGRRNMTKQERKRRDDVISKVISGPAYRPDINPDNGQVVNQSRRDIELFLAQPIINPHVYPYIFDQSKACSDDQVKFIIAVPSSPQNFANRKKVRENRGGTFTKNPKNRAKLLFFLGAMAPGARESQRVQEAIREEQSLYGDIVQSSFVDSYRNLTKKAALILKWSSSFCDMSKFVLRMDDDLRVNLTLMIRAMEATISTTTTTETKTKTKTKTKSTSTLTTATSSFSSIKKTDVSKNSSANGNRNVNNLNNNNDDDDKIKNKGEEKKAKDSHYVILGTVAHSWGPVRDPKSKYYTSVDVYPYKKLPDFLLGGAMGYSVETAGLLFQAYQRLLPFFLDDVFITAMCAPHVGVVIQNSDAFQFEHWKW